MNHLLKSCAVSAAALAVAMLTGCTSLKENRKPLKSETRSSCSTENLS